MIDDSFSFGGNVISYILNEIQIQNAIALMEYLFDDSDFLSGKVNSKGVQI